MVRRSRRSDKYKTVGLAIAMAIFAGWGLWVTSPNPELTTVAWDSPFDPSYVEQHTGRIVVEVSESFELLRTLMAIASAAGGEGTDDDRDAVERFWPLRDHKAVAAVRDALRTHDLSDLAGVFAFAFRDGRLERTMPHELPSFSESLEPHLSALQSFANESGFRSWFASERERFDDRLTQWRQQAPLEPIRHWLASEFPAIRHDAYRIIASPTDGGAPFSHNFTGDDPPYSEIVLFVPVEASPSDESQALRDGARRSWERAIFVEIARHYVSRMTDRYIRIVNRAFANVAIWRPGDLWQDPASVFNEYMTWAAYVLYARETESPETYAGVAQETIERMHERGWVRFEDFLERLANLYDERMESLGALYPRMIREVIRLANDYES